MRRPETSQSIFSRISSIIHEMIEETKKGGKEKVEMQFSAYFSSDAYLTFIGQVPYSKAASSVNDESQADFGDYLAIITGLKEDHDGRLMEYQTKFLD